jgi:hypothetical protein
VFTVAAGANYGDSLAETNVLETPRLASRSPRGFTVDYVRIGSGTQKAGFLGRVPG